MATGASRKSLFGGSTSSFSSISAINPPNSKPCPHEILFMQLTALEFDKFLKNESKKRNYICLKTIAFNGDMFKKANKVAFQGVIFFLTVKFAQLTKKTKWLQSIKFPAQSSEDEKSLRKSFTELIESLEKDPSFSTCKLPSIKMQLFQCYGDQLVLLFSKVASFIMLHQLPKTVKESITQRTMNNITCQEANQQHITAIKEAVLSYPNIKSEMNQDLSSLLETSHEFKVAISDAKCDYDQVKNYLIDLKGQVETKFNCTDVDTMEQILLDKVTHKRQSLQQLMNEKFSSPLFTPDRLITMNRSPSDTFSLLDTSQNLLKMKSQLDIILAPVSTRQLVELKETAAARLSRLSQSKSEAEENLPSSTLMSVDLKCLVNKQKCLIESSKVYQERKCQAEKLVNELPINRLNNLRFEPMKPVNGIRPWQVLMTSVMKEVKNYTQTIDGYKSNNNNVEFEPVRTSSLATDCGILCESDIDCELSRLSMFSPIDYSPQHNVFSEHNSSDLSKLLTDQLATSALIDASTETIDE